jgi:hypothetical protein
MGPLASMSAILLAASGPADRFAPGTWQVRFTLESAAAPRNKQTQTDIVRLSERQATQPPVSTFFTFFYPENRATDVRFENGSITGSYYQRRVDDLRGVLVPVTGHYSPTSFHVVLTFTAMGATAYQTLDGTLLARETRAN